MVRRSTCLPQERWQHRNQGTLPIIDFESWPHFDIINNHLDIHYNTLRLLETYVTGKDRIQLLQSEHMKFSFELVPDDIRYNDYHMGNLVDVADSEDENLLQYKTIFGYLSTARTTLFKNLDPIEKLLPY